MFGEDILGRSWASATGPPAPSPELSTSCEAGPHLARLSIVASRAHRSLKGVTLVKNRQMLHQIKNQRSTKHVFSANRRSSNHLIDAPNGRIDQMTPWHFFRFLAARYALPPKIEKNA